MCVEITATIITFNEEDRIGEAIASLSCCDEIVVVDSGSTDRTQEIAAARGARVIQRAWQGYSKQKNFAAEQARHDWILSIDADERLSIELADDIVNAFPGASAGAAYSMPRRAFYMGGGSTTRAGTRIAKCVYTIAGDAAGKATTSTRVCKSMARWEGFTAIFFTFRTGTGMITLQELRNIRNWQQKPPVPAGAAAMS